MVDPKIREMFKIVEKNVKDAIEIIMRAQDAMNLNFNTEPKL